jgi:hypothetical protein
LLLRGKRIYKGLSSRFTEENVHDMSLAVNLGGSALENAQPL